uniref:Uncharacterized protein n=1 Tax=Arundo donax TaxID=35708 RepID=A0A0A9CRL9_ARUDO
MFIFCTKRVSNGMFIFEVTTLMNSTPKTHLLLTKNPVDSSFSVQRGIMHAIPELVLAVWKLWLT